MGRKIKETPLRYCQYCGVKLERKIFSNGRLEDVAVFCKRKYCNRLCMRKDWLKKEKGNQTYRNAHITAQKINELILHKTVCENCGKIGKLDVHHIDNDYQNNEPSNLMVLCRSCHNKEHKKKGVCIICGEPMVGLGYCNKHYLRYRKYGDPLYISQYSRVDSQGEIKIIQLLQENNLQFIHNKSVFKDCVLFTGGIARFDFYIKDLTICPFRLSHDSFFCVGFTFLCGGSKVSIATDTGYLPEHAKQCMMGSDIIIIESNHDEEMLLNNEAYPAHLKKRILSNKGHLSNVACSNAIYELLQGGTRQFVLAHLSEKNNTPVLAYTTICSYLAAKNVIEGQNVFIDIAFPDRAGTMFTLTC